MKVDRLLLPLNLQLFADDGEVNVEQTEVGSENPAAGDKSFDDILKDKTMQSEFDKRMSKALETAKGKWDKDFQSKLDEATTEAGKLAKMNADQKAEYDRAKREEELGKREGDITRRELRAQALESLAEKGLPKTLADILVYTDADSTSKSIEAVDKAFRDAVEAGVNERLKGDPPKGGGSGKGNAVADEISKIFAQR
ncbi:hypothetical protein J2T12_005101 [Paenibacillus anaericanus]|uniref:DUF4355 domain-containing protein n=1 Tax=Paenibacillus anaericanus TaxID=170367 RepID=UPI0027820EF2|nr:DUF4355 domain-containing protein [Paenibacillus anaericanus]MDQ0091661.1 hypothetical protein [Paenibacillus anaericanus]